MRREAAGLERLAHRRLRPGILGMREVSGYRRVSRDGASTGDGGLGFGGENIGELGGDRVEVSRGRLPPRAHHVAVGDPRHRCDRKEPERTDGERELELDGEGSSGGTQGHG